MRRAALGLLICALIGGSADAKTRREMAPIDIHAEPIAAFQRFGAEVRFGEFEFRGGLVLSSPQPRFGGLSGIDLRPDGSSFIAIADTGHWLSGRLDRSGGRLVGVSETRWGAMLDESGRPLASRRVADAESLRLSPTGRGAYVSFEQSNDLRFYRFGVDPALARPERLAMLASARGLSRNRGLETVALAPQDGPLAGAPVIVAERSLDKAGDHRAWVLRGARAGAFSIVRRDDFDVTDGAFLPNGDLLILERSVMALPIGVGMRIRRIDGDTIRPGAVLDGPVVLEASMIDQIDNMEGLAISTDADGAIRVTLVSDNNLKTYQRTLLLEFIWLGADARLD